jgi:hypothetical protein
VLLPIKTLLMNTLTLGATLGILVLAFQEGWLDVPLDYTGPAAIEVTSVVFLFAILFGLATDYAVLVMARIKERHDRGDSNEEAVAIGISRTARPLSSWECRFLSALDTVRIIWVRHLMHIEHSMASTITARKWGVTIPQSRIVRTDGA